MVSAVRMVSKAGTLRITGIPCPSFAWTHPNRHKKIRSQPYHKSSRMAKEKLQKSWRVQHRAYLLCREDFPHCTTSDFQILIESKRMIARAYLDQAYTDQLQQEKRASPCLRMLVLEIAQKIFPMHDFQRYEDVEYFNNVWIDKLLDIASKATVHWQQEAIETHERMTKEALQERVEAFKALEHDRQLYIRKQRDTGNKSQLYEDDLERRENSLRARNRNYRNLEKRHWDWRQAALVEQRGWINRAWFRIKMPSWSYSLRLEIARR